MSTTITQRSDINSKTQEYAWLGVRAPSKGGFLSVHLEPVNNGPRLTRQIAHGARTALQFTSDKIHRAWETLKSDAEIFKFNREDVRDLCTITKPRELIISGILIPPTIFAEAYEIIFDSPTPASTLYNSSASALLGTIVISPMIGIAYAHKKQITSAVAHAYNNRHELFHKAAAAVANSAIKTVCKIADQLTVYNNIDLLTRYPVQRRSHLTANYDRQRNATWRRAASHPVRNNHLRRGSNFAYAGPR